MTPAKKKVKERPIARREMQPINHVTALTNDCRRRRRIVAGADSERESLLIATLS